MQINAPIENLLGNVLELKNDIHEIQDYLDPTSDVAPLPLGEMGKIMAQQLFAETNVLAYHAEQLRTKKGSAWELARHSNVLKNKVALLGTFAGIIAQLANGDRQIQHKTTSMSSRIISRCKKIEEMIEALASVAVVSKRKSVSV